MIKVSKLSAFACYWTIIIIIIIIKIKAGQKYLSTDQDAENSLYFIKEKPFMYLVTLFTLHSVDIMMLT